MLRTIKTVEKLLRDKKISFDKVGQKINGNFYIMYGFYYKLSSSKELAVKLKDILLNVNIVETKDVWKPFIGSAPVEKQSHYYVEFNFMY
jgi:hypothetical protein